MKKHSFSLRQLVDVLRSGTRTINEMADGERLEFPCLCLAETFASCTHDEAFWTLRRVCLRHEYILVNAIGGTTVKNRADRLEAAPIAEESQSAT